MELFLLFQQLFLTAFVTLVVSFLLTKFCLSSSNSTGDCVERGQKGHQESVKLTKVLKVGGAKSKRKRVRFVDDGGDQEVGKVGNFSGFDEGSDHGVDKVGDFSGFEGFEGEFSGGLDVGLMDDGQVFDGVAVRDVGSGEVVEERCEIDGGIVDFGFEKIVKLVCDDVGEGSDLVEMVVGDNGNEGDLKNQDLSDFSVERKNGCEGVDDECVGVAGDDGVHDQSGELEVGKGLIVEERSEAESKEGDVVSAAFDEDICIEEADNEKKVGLRGDDVLEDRSGEVRVLKDLVYAESVVDGVIKQENVVNSAVDNVVISEMNENEMVGDDRSVTLASGGVVMDQNEEVGDVEVSQGRTGVEEEMDKENSAGKGLVSDDDDDWEGIERSDLEKVFAAAANYVENAGKVDKLLNLGDDEQMQLYALHKTAMEGPCYEGQPMALKIAARAKWNAWQRLGNMSPEVAMEQYVSLLSDKDPSWMEGQTSVDKPDLLEFANPGTPETINKHIQYDIFFWTRLPKSRLILAAKCIGVCFFCSYYY